MKVAYLSGAYIPARGANSIHVMRMCQAMAKLGHQVTLYAYRGNSVSGNDFDFYGVDQCFQLVKVSRLNVRILGAALGAWKMRRAVLNGNSPDLIYAREFWALFLLSKSGLPFIFESHWRPKSLIHRYVEGFFMRRGEFRRAVLISAELKKIYSEEYSWLPDEKMMVAHDGADPEAPGKTPSRSFGRDLALQVGYVGSFWPGYGVNLIKELALEIQEADFHIIGGRPEQVSNLTRRDAAINNLRYHGFISPARLPAYYSALDVLLAPYQGPTPHIQWISPMKLFEYMAHGKAIVCSDFPVMREIIEDGRDGLLVPAGDKNGWVNAIRNLMHPARRDELGRAARTRLEREFTWEIRARRVLDGVA